MDMNSANIEQIVKAAAVLADHIKTDADPELLSIISSAKTIALYRAVKGELSCDGVTEYLLSQGKTVCFPRVKGETMDFYEITDLDKDFSIGA